MHDKAYVFMIRMNAHLFATGSFLATAVTETTKEAIAITPQLNLVNFVPDLEQRRIWEFGFSVDDSTALVL
ncbi:hypothetical protein Y032_0030g2135 [Ancylostoma ceylanicum]|uniref:Uncharacterized protein n=1 Tax=Ancylostoma ceylanicum TaxID=53326 RepID=A0A016UQ98_9BILA|nr:hypothetical protein Y032_0030g2135 [Ancylostoma ceylanicum]